MIYVHKGTLKVVLEKVINPDTVVTKTEYLHEGDYIDSIWKHNSEYSTFIIKEITGDCNSSHLKLKEEKDSLMQKSRTLCNL